ncbi:hypothetical protein [Pedobacter sp. UYP1]|uniref:hypothetical protein n=1 Tax=Pedobacter sp. UYP1 TaxID=1756396 RepID=UPI00339147BC
MLKKEPAPQVYDLIYIFFEPCSSDHIYKKDAHFEQLTYPDQEALAGKNALIPYYLKIRHKKKVFLNE